MHRYTYKAMDASGNLVKGIAECQDSSVLIDDLKKKGLYIIEIVSISSIFYSSINICRIKLSDISLFCSQFGAMFKAGISILNCLKILGMQTENRRLKEVISKTYQEVENGRTLSEAMSLSKEFPKLLISMVETGEISGQIDYVMTSMALYYDKENKFKQKIISALLYPALVASTSIIAAAFFINSVLPMLLGIFEKDNSSLPFLTRLLISINNGFKNYWYLIIAFAIMISIFLYRYFKTYEGRYICGRLIFKIPLLGEIYKKLTASRFSNTLSILLKNGVPIIKAMDMLEKTFMNAAVEKVIHECRKEVEKGESLSKPMMSSGVFPQMMAQMIYIGEESGTLDNMLHMTAKYYDDQVDIISNRIADILNPVIILFLGIFICLMISAMVAPIFNMYGAIK